jgi:hypothetical protein
LEAFSSENAFVKGGIYMTIASGERLLAQDMLDMTFFPAGMIMMMDGSWQDGRGGWYICDGRNTPYGQTPNLKDRFIKGSGDTPAIGGSNSLTADLLPKHTHGFTTSSTDKKLTGSFPVLHAQTAGGGVSDGVAQSRNAPGIKSANGGGATYGSEFTINADHNHSGTTNDNNGTTSVYNNMPSYYSVIYIKKMTGNNL